MKKKKNNHIISQAINGYIYLTLWVSFLVETQLLGDISSSNMCMHEGFLYSFNSIALRMAKTLWSFGCSEGNGVKYIFIVHKPRKGEHLMIVLG